MRLPHSSVTNSRSGVVEGIRMGGPVHGRPSRRRTVATLLLGGSLFLGVYGGPPLDRISGLDLRFGLSGPSAGDPWKWIGALLLVAVVLVVERRDLASLLFRRPTGADLRWVLYAFGIVMAWQWLMQLLAPQRGNDGVTAITTLGVAGVVVLIITAAVTEEIVYRGFLAERIADLLGAAPWARWVGAGVSLLLFIGPHVGFFGPSWLLHQLPGAVALALTVVLRRNLSAAMLLHLLLNAPILIPTMAASVG